MRGSSREGAVEETKAEGEGMTPDEIAEYFAGNPAEEERYQVFVSRLLGEIRITSHGDHRPRAYVAMSPDLDAAGVYPKDAQEALSRGWRAYP